MGFDFGVGYSELFVLAVIAVIVIGPKDLPRVLRMFGQFMRKAKGMAREFQGHVDAAMKDAGVDGLKKDLQELRGSVNASMTASSPTTKANTSPSMPVPSFPTVNPNKDFETYFGVDAKPGETRLAGTLVSTPGEA